MLGADVQQVCAAAAEGVSTAMGTKWLGTFMFARIKQVAAVGAAVVGIGWMGVVSPAVAYTQPPRIPAGNEPPCPVGGVQYAPDPNLDAYDVCVAGFVAEGPSYICPPGWLLNMNTIPPTCVNPHHKAPS